tara:strand:+ start:402 stop:626 length:225 start_codon:yes stop_codon:yes gene_type:complete
MSECKKIFEINDEYVKISKVHFADGSKPENMYLLEWKFENDYSFDENFYTYYSDALSGFNEYKQKLKNKHKKKV